MSDHFPERDLLRSLDPAPREVTADAQVQNLHTVIARVTAPVSREPRTASRKWLRIALPVAGVAAAAAIALPLALVQPATDPVTGPATAQPDRSNAPTTGPSVLTVGNRTKDGTTVLARTDVGDALFLLGQRGDEIRFAASFDGSDPGENWERVTAKPVAADDVTVLSAGNSADRYATLVGQVGPDVRSVDVRTHDGRTVPASISNGYYIAAWEGPDFADRDHLDQTVTVHLRDGRTTTASYLQYAAE